MFCIILCDGHQACPQKRQRRSGNKAYSTPSPIDRRKSTPRKTMWEQHLGDQEESLLEFKGKCKAKWFTQWRIGYCEQYWLNLTCKWWFLVVYYLDLEIIKAENDRLLQCGGHAGDVWLWISFHLKVTWSSVPSFPRHTHTLPFINW